MRVVDTRSSNTVSASSKQLAEGSDKVSQATEAGNLQDGEQCWVAAVSKSSRSASLRVSEQGIICSVLCRLLHL